MKKTVRIGLAATIAVSTGLVSLTGTMATANADPANASTIHAPLISSSTQNPAPGPVPGLGTPQPVTVPGETAPPVVKKQAPPVTTTTAPAANPADLPPGVPGPLDPADPAIYNSSNPAGQGISKSVANNFGTGSGTYKIGAPVAGCASSGVVPQGLESYYSQKINWESCQDYGTGDYFTGAAFTCGYAIVPLDYSKPAGTTIAVAMLRVYLPGGNAKKQNLFMDPGGPGFPGMSLANGIGVYFNQAKLLGHYDLIGFDPRGVGSSAPAIQCASDKFLDAQHQGSDLLSSAELTKAAERNTQACYNNTGKGFGISGDDFISNVGTK